MKLIINESQINEMAINLSKSYKLSDFLIKSVKEQNHSLSNNPSFPTHNNQPFDYLLLKKRYKDIVDNIERIQDLESLDIDYLSSVLSKTIKEVVEIEKPIREQLEKICYNIIVELFGIPEESLIFSANLVDNLSNQKGLNLTPESSDSNDYEFEDLDEISETDYEIVKRRNIDALIQGASYLYTYNSDIFDKVSEINERLPLLYEKIIAINDYLLFNKKERITDRKRFQGAYVETIIGSDIEKAQIKVQGITLFFLLQESFRGFFELFAAHGLPNDKAKAKFVLSQSDFLFAEPWDLRFGVEMWKKITDDKYVEPKIMPYFFSYLCQIPSHYFIKVVKESMASTKKGKRFISSLLSEAEYDTDMADFQKAMKTKNDEVGQINDCYLSVDDLDNFEIDSNNDEIIEEND